MLFTDFPPMLRIDPLRIEGGENFPALPAIPYGQCSPFGVVRRVIGSEPGA